MIEALHDILKNSNNIQVYFYGKGYYEEAIRATITEISLTNKIHMVGFVKDVYKLTMSKILK